MSYIRIPNPRRNKFWHSPAFILKRVRQPQPSPEELTAALEKKRVYNGLPTAVDRWIAAGLGSARANPAEAPVLPTLADILEDLVECQLSTVETEVSPFPLPLPWIKLSVGCY
jgi:hypothetical protein